MSKETNPEISKEIPYSRWKQWYGEESLGRLVSQIEAIEKAEVAGDTAEMARLIACMEEESSAQEALESTPNALGVNDAGRFSLSSAIDPSALANTLSTPILPPAPTALALTAAATSVAVSPVLKPSPTSLADAVRSSVVASTTAAPTPSAVASTTYHFPNEMHGFRVLLPKLREKCAADLLDIIRRVSPVLDVKGIPVPYSRVRDAFCAASIALNEKNAFPPRVRETRKFIKLSGAKKTSAEASEISNDRQVIDLHWLCRNEAIGGEKKWSRMCVAGAFDFSMGSDFAAKVGTPDRKAEVLGLSQTQQIKLAVIQSKPTYDKWANIIKGKGRVASW